MNRINVLINAYAVSPKWGSEPGLGWNWIINLAKYCNVYVITEGEWRTEIEEVLNNHPLKEFVHFYYNETTSKIRKICWDQGDWRFYYFYRKWQKKTLCIAKDIIRNHKIDIIHQLNMIGYREPGALWEIKDIPFVWGPIGGYGWTTLKYLNGQPFKLKCKAFFKNIINAAQAHFYPIPRHALNRASLVLAANSNVYKYIKRNLREDVVLLNETGCYEKFIPCNNNFKQKSNEFEILWVGKFDYRKQLGLAILTLSKLVTNYPFIKLNIVGDTCNSAYLRLVKLSQKLNLQNNIKWYGKIPNDKVHKLMQESDIFLFTSIDEGTPHVVLEAVQNNLPIVCFDTCGQGDVVNETIGAKVKLSNYKKSPSDFAEEISKLIDDRETLKTMRQNCLLRQTQLSWDCKMKYVVSLYESILNIEMAKSI